MFNNNYYQPAITGVVRLLLVLNVAIYFISGIVVGEDITYEYFAVYYPESTKFQPMQLLTYMFLHGSLGHIFFNMLGLYFSDPLSSTIGDPNVFYSIIFLRV